MSDVNAILAASAVFGELDEAAIDRLGSCFDTWSTDPGDLLARPGDRSHHYFLLEEGRILVGYDDGRAVVLDTPGDFIGLEMVSCKGISKATVTVLRKGRVHVIERAVFLDLIQEDTHEAAQIMEQWQAFLDNTAPFARNSERIAFQDHF